MLLVLSIALLGGGLSLLASAQASDRRRHRRPELEPNARRLHRVGGAAALTASLASAGAALGAGFGVIFWTIALGLAGLAIAVGRGLRLGRTATRVRPRRRRHSS